MDATDDLPTALPQALLPNVAALWLGLKIQLTDMILRDKPSDWEEAAIQKDVIRIMIKVRSAPHIQFLSHIS